ncbi:hypothetical protein Cfor_07832, partial [Coptotermes formosanus]
VTTACRLSEVVVSPDGSDLRRGAFHGAVRAPLQRLQQQQRPRRYEGARPRRRRQIRQIPKSHHKVPGLQRQIDNIRGRITKVPVLQQKVETCWI